MIYFDNSATTFKKPEEVINAVCSFMREINSNPGRSGHRKSIDAAYKIYEARESIAELFNADDPVRVVFTLNATAALNTAIRGLLKKGDHVITSSLEHNSVMRPLNDLKNSSIIEYTAVHGDKCGFITADDIEKEIRDNTKAVIINHASNVIGTIQNIEEIGRLAKKRGLLFIVDASQTAGAVDIDMKRDSIDILAFTGHKYLFGPQGTGGMVIGDSVDISKFDYNISGGTGSRSEEELQPEILPDKYESGTPNTPGIAGLYEGIKFILETGIDKIRIHEIKLTKRLLNGLKEIDNVELYGSMDPEKITATISFNIKDKDPAETAFELDDEFDIMTRVGLHCSPSAHKLVSTFPYGTIRLSMCYFNTIEEVDDVIKAVKTISERT